MAKTKDKADNFNVAKADIKVMLASLEALGLGTAGTKAEKAKRLREHFSKTPKAQLLECSECGGDSTADFDACPFCGETDADEAPASEPASEPAPKAPKAPKASKGKKRSEATSKKAPSKPEKAPETPSTPSPKERAAGAAGAKGSGKATKGKAKGKAAPVEAVAEPVTTLVTTPTPMVSKFKVADLDASVAEVQRLKLAVVRNYYQLGRELRKLYESEMWQLRTEEGAPKYTNWKQFTSSELDLSYLQTYKLMDVAASFTEEDVTAIGHSKLNLVLKVPEEYRDKLLGEAKGGASKRDLEERVAEINRAERGEAPAPTPKKDRVTVAVVPGRKTHTLLKRRKGKEVPSPAKTLADGPWVEVELSNDVIAVYRVTKTPKGDLALIIEHKRIKA